MAQLLRHHRAAVTAPDPSFRDEPRPWGTGWTIVTFVVFAPVTFLVMIAAGGFGSWLVTLLAPLAVPTVLSLAFATVHHGIVLPRLRMRCRAFNERVREQHRAREATVRQLARQADDAWRELERRRERLPVRPEYEHNAPATLFAAAALEDGRADTVMGAFRLYETTQEETAKRGVRGGFQ
ncbi:hypothetical protein GCM10009862_25880 [Microbacterium binotii]|uniref:Uncharacterized protein n=2 Tax=Microbacterium binotii TaxID=462710 RepID=A0ABP6BT46_9MICO